MALSFNWEVTAAWSEPFNKTFKMSSPSDSSPCTSESDLESFTVDEVMGELSEFAPYDDSCEPLATEEEAADYNERVHREEEEEQQFNQSKGNQRGTTLH